MRSEEIVTEKCAQGLIQRIPLSGFCLAADRLARVVQADPHGLAAQFGQGKEVCILAEGAAQIVKDLTECTAVLCCVVS